MEPKKNTFWIIRTIRVPAARHAASIPWSRPCYARRPFARLENGDETVERNICIYLNVIHKRIYDIYLNKYPTISYVGYINSYTQSTMAIERSLIIGFSGLYTKFFIVMLTKSSVFFAASQQWRSRSWDLSFSVQNDVVPRVKKKGSQTPFLMLNIPR